MVQVLLIDLDHGPENEKTAYNLPHPQADVDRLYCRRSEGGRGMISIENCLTIDMQFECIHLKLVMKGCSKRFIEKKFYEKKTRVRIGQRSWKKGSKDSWINYMYSTVSSLRILESYLSSR